MKSESKEQNDNACANCGAYLFDYGLKQPYCSECYEEVKAQPQYKETAECLAEELMLEQKKLAAAEKTINNVLLSIREAHSESGCFPGDCLMCNWEKMLEASR